MLRFLALSLALGASLAGAESNTMTGRPGFFEPTPDGNSSISRIVPLEETAPSPPAPAAAEATPAVATAPTEAKTDTPEERVRKSEDDLDRAEREHREMTARSVQSATTIEGAYDGLTSERSR